MWVKIDDGFATHPKILKAGITALGIQVRAICYSSQNQTDGYLPIEALPIILLGVGVEGTDWSEHMVSNGLWDRVEGGYEVHDYLEWNVSKKERAAWKKKLSRSGKKGMKSRWNKENSDITTPITEVITEVITDSITPTSTSTSTLLNLKSGTLESFVLTPELEAWAAKEAIQNPAQYVEEFKDYWRSTGGKRKNGQPIRDWPATFRNRLRDMKKLGQLKVTAPKFTGHTKVCL